MESSDSQPVVRQNTCSFKHYSGYFVEFKLPFSWPKNAENQCLFNSLTIGINECLKDSNTCLSRLYIIPESFYPQKLLPIWCCLFTGGLNSWIFHRVFWYWQPSLYIHTCAFFLSAIHKKLLWDKPPLFLQYYSQYLTQILTEICDSNLRWGKNRW